MMADGGRYSAQSSSSYTPDRLAVDSDKEEPSRRCSPVLWRNLSGFWLLGLCNNYAYVVMLSAAHDILAKQQSTSFNMTDLMPSNPINKTHLIPHCNKIGTGAVLLADILPSFVIKITAPFFIQAIPYWFRVIFLVGCPAISSFLLVAYSDAVWMSLLGVVLASVSSGVGEITFLALSSHFDRNVLSTWSSGTGGAGVIGATSYAGLISLGLTPRNTLLVMVVVPLILVASYFLLLVKSPSIDNGRGIDFRAASEGASQPLIVSQNEIAERRKNAMERGKTLSLQSKLLLIKPLLKYMIPLGVVYFAEYFINQGLTELVEFEDIWLTLGEQYRWYAVLYQVGVFISRSSANLFRIRKIWLLGVLQMLNVVVLLIQIYVKFMPVIWIMFLFILYEGLLGGAAYVNTFFMVSEMIELQYLEFSMGVASVADSAGIVLAGLLAVPAHNYLCSVYA